MKSDIRRQLTNTCAHAQAYYPLTGTCMHTYIQYMYTHIMHHQNEYNSHYTTEIHQPTMYVHTYMHHVYTAKYMYM